MKHSYIINYWKKVTWFKTTVKKTISVSTLLYMYINKLDWHSNRRFATIYLINMLYFFLPLHKNSGFSEECFYIKALFSISLYKLNLKCGLKPQRGVDVNFGTNEDLTKFSTNRPFLNPISLTLIVKLPWDTFCCDLVLCADLIWIEFKIIYIYILFLLISNDTLKMYYYCTVK